VRREAQRFQEAISKADIRQPGFLKIDAQREVVEFWAVATVLASDSTREQRYSEPQCPQQSGKSSIQFVAEAAAFFIHDLVQNAALVTDDFSPYVDIEIFEGDGEEVRAMQGA
jgi:hypothetical protein